MHVHLVAVKVGVVGRRDAEVEPERRVRQDAHAVRHHAHLVQRGRAVKDDVVAVAQVALDDVAGLECEVDLVPV